MITNYIKQRREMTDDALKTPLSISQPKADAKDQTLNVTQLKDYMVTLIHRGRRVVDFVPLAECFVCHCIDGNRSVLVVYDTTH